MTKFYDAATFYVRFLYCQNLSREKDIGIVIEARNQSFCRIIFRTWQDQQNFLEIFFRFSWFLAWKGSWKSEHNGLERFSLRLLIKPSDSESEIRNRQKRNVLFLCLSPYAYPWASKRFKAIFKVIQLVLVRCRTNYFVVVLFMLEDFAEIISTTKLVMQIVHFDDFKKSIKYELALHRKPAKTERKE